MTGLCTGHLEAYKRIKFEKCEAPLLLLYVHFWGNQNGNGHY